jgi:AcrR family transcriptional regulator
MADYSPVMSGDNGPRSGSIPVGLAETRVRAVRRSDAVRNRDRILGATRELLETRTLADVSMDEIAAAAGVGKGTLFRAFGDKSGLAEALLDAAERRLQASVLTGPPPLGPGAAPEARIGAFVPAYLAFVERHLDLLLVVDSGAPTARFRTGAYRGWVLHLRAQLAELDSSLDAEATAHAILAIADPALVGHLRREEGFGKARVKAMAERAVNGMLGQRPDR